MSESGFFVPYPAFDECEDRAAFRLRVLGFAHLQAHLLQLQDDVLLAQGVAVSDRLAKEEADLQKLVSFELDRDPLYGPIRSRVRAGAQPLLDMFAALLVNREKCRLDSDKCCSVNGLEGSHPASVSRKPRQ